MEAEYKHYLQWNLLTATEQDGKEKVTTIQQSRK